MKSESSQSLEVKLKIVKVLVLQGGADPLIENRFRVSSLNLARCLSDKFETMKFLNSVSQKTKKD